MKTFSLRRVVIAVSVVLTGTSVSVVADDNQLNETNTNIETIVVSGNKSEQNLGDVSGSISVMTSEDIQKQVVTDMKDLFKYEPGVTVVGGNGDAQNVVVRGMGGDRVLMIKDGMRMNEGYGANGQNDVVGRGFIDTDILKQVEVSKSAASSLYGSDAIGGVVVFTTKDPSDLLQGNDTYFSLKAGYAGESSQSFTGITAAYDSGDFEQLITATYRDGNESQNYDDNLKPVDVESYDVFYKALYNVSPLAQLKFTADVWQQDVSSPYAIYADNFRTLPGYYVGNESTDGDQENTSLKISYHSQASNAWYDDVNVALYRNKTVQDDEEYFEVEVKDSPYGPDSFRNISQFSTYEQTTIGLISNGFKRLTLNDVSHTIGFGVDVEETNSLRTVHEFRLKNGEVDRDIRTSKFPENDTLRAGVFVNDTIALGKLTLTPGLRFDYYDMDPENAEKTDAPQFEAIDDQQFSPSFGAVYKFNPMLSGFVQYAAGYKVPPYDLAYIDHDNSMAGYRIIATDHLDPETSDSFEIGMRGHLGSFAFSSAVFYNKYDDFINTALIDTEDGLFGPVQVYQYENIDSVTIKGAEVGVTYYLGDTWSIYGNAAYIDGKDDNTDDYIQTINPISGTAGIAYEQMNWGIDGVLRWAKSMNKVNDDEHKTAGFGAVDVIGHYTFKEDLTLNLRVENLLDKEYVQHINVAGSSADIDLNNFTEAGRNVSLSVNYTF